MNNESINMKMLLFLVSIILIWGCSIHGHYTSNPKSAMAMAGYEIILTKNKTFHIKSWTDNYSNYVDSLGNRIWKDPKYRGFGTFIKNGDFLELTFLNEDSILIEIIKTTENSLSNYKLSVKSETGKVYSPFVSLKDSSLKTLKTEYNKNDKYTEFRSSSESEIEIIGFDMHMFRAPLILIPLEKVNLGRNEFKFKTYHGYYSKGTKIDFYCEKAWSGIRYGPRKRWLAKKYKSKWLNKFYKS